MICYFNYSKPTSTLLCDALNWAMPLSTEVSASYQIFTQDLIHFMSFISTKITRPIFKINPVYKLRFTYQSAIKPSTVNLGPYNYLSFLRYRCLLELIGLQPYRSHLTPYFQDSDLKLTETRLAWMTSRGGSSRELLVPFKFI